MVTNLRKRQYERGLVNDDIAAGAAIELSKIAGSADLTKRDGSVAFTANQSMGGNRLTNLAEPLNPQDAATKAYVDATIQGLDPKDSCRVATTANITLSGTQTIDAIALSVGNRVLVKNQTTGSQNGIYTVQAGAWIRAIDADANNEVTPGMFTFVEEGSVNANSGWVLTTTGSITLGTTALAFAQFSGAGQIDAGAGLTKTGNQLNVVSANTGRIVVNADSIDLGLSGVTAGTQLKVELLAIDTYGRITGRNAATTNHVDEGTNNLYFTASRVRNDVPLTGLTEQTGEFAAGDSILTAFGKAMGRINTKQAGHANLTAFSGLTGAADRLPYFTAASTLTLAPFTGFGRSLVDDVDATTARATLGLVIGTNVQAYNATLAAIASIGAAGTNGFLKKTALDTWSVDTNTYLTTAAGVTLSKVRTRESLAGVQNGTNRIFNLSNTPVAGTEHIFMNGSLLNSGIGNDYEIAGTTVTFSAQIAPYSDDIILASYIAQ